MQIGGPPPVGGPGGVKGPKREKSISKKGSQAQGLGQEKVEISQRAKEHQKLVEAAAILPDVRTSEVERVKDLIDSEQLDESGERVAKDLIRNNLRRRST